MTFIRSMQILILVVIVSILIIGAFALGLHYGKNMSKSANEAPVATAQNETQQMLEKIIEESGVINGTLVAIDGPKLTIESQTPSLNPLQPPVTQRKVVMVTSTTKITKQTPKPAQEIQKSQEAFIQSIIKATSTAAVTPPTTYTETPATTADLVVGSTLIVNTAKQGDTYSAVTIGIN